MPEGTENTQESVILPTVEDLIRETSVHSPDEEKSRWEDETQYEEIFEETAINAERAWTHLKGLQDHYRLKGRWSTALMWLLGGMIFFQWVLIAFVGWGLWDFTQYQWLLPVLLVQNLGQIIGLAIIVVRSLFKDLDPRK